MSSFLYQLTAAAEGVYIWGGSGGQKDNYIHTHTRVQNVGYAIKTMEMYQSSELVDHFVIYIPWLLPPDLCILLALYAHAR